MSTKHYPTERSGGTTSIPPRATTSNLQIVETCEVDELVLEAGHNEAIWGHVTTRQETAQCQRETQTIFLRGLKKPYPEGTASRDVRDSAPTKVAESFPKLMRWAEQFAGRVGGELGRLFLVRLQPRGQIYEHVDEGEYYKVRDRYHLVLRSPGGSEMLCGDERVVFREGELWWFDNKSPHEAFNHSDEPRTHLIFDVLPRRRSGVLWRRIYEDANPSR
jgi:hypothetical protein